MSIGLLPFDLRQRSGGEIGPEAPVPIHQRRWEFEELLMIYRSRRPKVSVELGTYHGGTLYHWLSAATWPTLVVSVDPYEMNLAEGITESVDNRGLYKDWSETAGHVALEGRSRDHYVLEAVRRFSPIDWLFIDASHLYEEVRADWEAYLPFCRRGSIVAFHDILPSPKPELQVDRLWEEIQRLGFVTQEIVWKPEPPWPDDGAFGIGVVYL